jgi:predicted MPP superfamily phosphohydrolase
MEWSGWSTIRHALAHRRQRSSIEPFHLGPETGLDPSRWALEARASSWHSPIDVTDQRIWINGLPEGFRGFRILQLSDIHHSRFFPLDRVARMVELSNRLQPDLVALTGDLVTYSRASIEPMAEMLGALEARAGVVAVLGNHDFRVGAATIERALRRRGIEVLRNRHILLQRGGDTLPVAGVDDYRYGADPERALRGIPEGLPTMLLAHNPRLLERLAWHGVSLVLSGHTHGGQVNLPLLGTIYGRSPERLRFKMGWDRLGATQIYVSRGIGTIVLPWRLRCPAEMPWLELLPHKDQELLPQHDQEPRFEAPFQAAVAHDGCFRSAGKATTH